MKSEIKKIDGIWQLEVNEKPFTMLGGEVHNSAASSAEYMEEMVWSKIRCLNLNSLLLPVTWEQIEQEEGKFDFSVLDEIVKQAYREKIKLGILWFGLWKNGISSYIPFWMKQDSQNRFFRVQDKYGKRMNVISPFCKAAVEADARAFQKLMEHIVLLNDMYETIILIQVENEVGLLGSDRDYSEKANDIFKKAIPEDVASVLEVPSGSWQETLGENAAEILMEYGYAKALGYIAEEGKKVCNLPMYVNAWIEKFPWRPGSYPSGGPIARFHTLWKYFAPYIDVMAPDVYSSDFVNLCDEYKKEENPLLIPEHRRDIKCLSHVFYAVGVCNSIGFSPFGIEDFTMSLEEKKGIANPVVMSILNIDVKAWNCDGSVDFLGKAYKLLDSMDETLRDGRRNQKIQGFLRKDEYEKGTVIHLETCDIRIDYMDKSENTPKAAGFIVENGENGCYIAGVNFKFTIMAKKEERREISILEYAEGEFINNQFCTKRILNGDEQYCMMFMEEPEVQKIEWYFY